MPYALMSFVSLIPKAQQTDQTPPPERGGSRNSENTKRDLTQNRTSACSLQTKGKGQTDRERWVGSSKNQDVQEVGWRWRNPYWSKRRETERLTRPLLPLRLEDKDGLQTSVGAAHREKGVGAYRKMEKEVNMGPFHATALQAIPGDIQTDAVRPARLKFRTVRINLEEVSEGLVALLE